MTSKNQPATWNRDDRDLLIELRTSMQNMRDDISGARTEIKEINTGITARLLNLETNAVSKIAVEVLAQRVRDLEDGNNQWVGKREIIVSVIGIIAGIAGAVIQAGVWR